ncbi:MAG: hypothetical protein JXQ23_13890 [Clostridia bacterium]|nr:hypothetical protein [Clostridia bacterium]
MEKMTSKERLLNSIKGMETDHLAWSPFLAYFWDFQPEEVTKKGMLEFYKEIGADPLFRGFCTLIKKNYKNVTISDKTDGLKRQVIYETEKGNLTFGYVYATESRSWFLKDHPVKTEDDFKKLIYLYENLQIEKDFSKYENGLKAVNDQALLIPIIGAEMKSSFQSLLEHWVGTVDLTYALYDFPELVQEALAVMQKKSMDAVEIACDSKAESFIFWEDSSTTNLSPDQFSEFVAPEINQWGKLLHQNNQMLVHHACGLIKDLLPLMAKTDIDMIESISPPPTGNVYTYEAREVLPERIGLIGGIDAVVLESYPVNDLYDYVKDIIMKTNRRKFILGNSDSCPPRVDIEKFKMISRLVKEF